MLKLKRCATACLLFMSALAQAAGPKAEVIHWWTSGGESAAVKKFTEAYQAAGGVWLDTAIAGGEQARAVAINRIVGGKPPTAAQFNTSKQFLDIVEQGMLNNLDEIALAGGWDKFLPETVLNVVRVKGHFYAAPVNIHMPTWIWYSKAAFKKAGIASEPKTMDELFVALDKLKAAGLIPLAHGGQPWQDGTVFTAVLANMGGTDLYLKVFRDRDTKAISQPTNACSRMWTKARQAGCGMIRRPCSSPVKRVFKSWEIGPKGSLPWPSKWLVKTLAASQGSGPIRLM